MKKLASVILSTVLALAPLTAFADSSEEGHKLTISGNAVVSNTQVYLNNSPNNLPVHIEAFGPTTIQPSTFHVFTYVVPYIGNPVCTVSSSNSTPVLNLLIPPGNGQVLVNNYSGSVITQAEVICIGN